MESPRRFLILPALSCTNNITALSRSLPSASVPTTSFTLRIVSTTCFTVLPGHPLLSVPNTSFTLTVHKPILELSPHIDTKSVSFLQHFESYRSLIHLSD